MPMDELIRAIEKADSENIQDLINAVVARYRELFPKWEIIFLTVEREKIHGENDLVSSILQIAHLLGDSENG